jgi:hypothetical protein
MRGAHKSRSLNGVQFQRGKERTRKEITVGAHSRAQLLWRSCCIAVTSSRQPGSNGAVAPIAIVQRVAARCSLT